MFVAGPVFARPRHYAQGKSEGLSSSPTACHNQRNEILVQGRVALYPGDVDDEVPIRAAPDWVRLRPCMGRLPSLPPSEYM